MVPRQCLLILLVEGKALGSEKSKVLRCGLCYEQRRQVELGLCMIEINFDINVEKASFEQNFYLILDKNSVPT
jgi:hypothetical protein